MERRVCYSYSSNDVYSSEKCIGSPGIVSAHCVCVCVCVCDVREVGGANHIMHYA